MSHQEVLVQLQRLYVPGARKAESSSRRRGGTDWSTTIKDLACLSTHLSTARKREAASQMLRSNSRRENTSTGQTETPLSKPPVGTLDGLERSQHTSPVLKLRSFCFYGRIGLREHTMPSVETPCLEGRTVAHLGKVRVKHINEGSGAHSSETLGL